MAAIVDMYVELMAQITNSPGLITALPFIAVVVTGLTASLLFYALVVGSRKRERRAREELDRLKAEKQSNERETTTRGRVGVEEAAKLLAPEGVYPPRATEEGRRQVVVIDVRPPSEFAEGHFADAVALPLINDDDAKRLKGISREGSRQWETTRLVLRRLEDFMSDAVTAVGVVSAGGPVDNYVDYDGEQLPATGPDAQAKVFVIGEGSVVAASVLQSAGMDAVAVDGSYNELWSRMFD